MTRDAGPVHLRLTSASVTVAIPALQQASGPKPAKKTGAGPGGGAP